MLTSILLLQADPAQGGSALTIPFLLVAVGIFYFFMIRPSIKEQKAQTNFSDSLKKGSRVVTAGGIHGTISSIDDNVISLLIAPKTAIKVQRSYISSELTNAAYGEKAATATTSTKE